MLQFTEWCMLLAFLECYVCCLCLYTGLLLQTLSRLKVLIPGTKAEFPRLHIMTFEVKHHLQQTCLFSFSFCSSCLNLREATGAMRILLSHARLKASCSSALFSLALSSACRQPSTSAANLECKPAWILQAQLRQSGGTDNVYAVGSLHCACSAFTAHTIAISFQKGMKTSCHSKQHKLKHGLMPGSDLPALACVACGVGHREIC